MILPFSRALALLAFGAAAADVSPRAQWPYGPLTTNGTSIIDSRGDNITYAGVNWPGATEVMLPEGLQYQSIEAIVSRIKELGMNSIRLTWATELVDQIYERNMTDVPIQESLVTALGEKNGTAVFEKVMTNNPALGRNATRLQMYDAIAEECARQSIYVHLDNHISKASWCCGLNDGNSWWGDTYFSPSNWTRGLAYMAAHGKQWPNLVSMSLYNELRPPFGSGKDGLLETYNWETWYDQVKRGAEAIHGANADLLVFLSGLAGDTDLKAVVDGTLLDPGNATFSTADFASGLADKLVFELHSYSIVTPVIDCPSYNTGLIDSGYSAMVPAANSANDTAKNHLPVVMSEWGFPNDDTTWRNDTYAVCVQQFLRDVVPGAGWMVWVLAGSYYIREGQQDYNETWGLLNHDWSDWRSPAYIEGGIKPLVAASLAAVNSTNTSTSTNGSTSSGSDGGATSAGVHWRGDRTELLKMIPWVLTICLVAFV